MADSQEPSVGFVAARVGDAGDGTRIDVAHPFLLQESEGRPRLAFGTLDTDPSVQDEIVAAFVDGRGGATFIVSRLPSRPC
jgi:hypothetical protein